MSDPQTMQEMARRVAEVEEARRAYDPPPVPDATPATPYEPPVGAFDTSSAARWQWPYLSWSYLRPQAYRNGRELGQWITGHLFGRTMHEHTGLRIQVDDELLDGVFGVLGRAGIVALPHSTTTEDGRTLVTIDVWTQS